ncbi:unnamed protein product [Chondrus crispus]|uniref:Uncharacterized protein n=1 Tax=Chondrus crispus TaxID=2769 RepID=R7Q262_CHOCR|nr:unnamed protein product [Chondrus crispus]CDF32682.1 unnamed protein product [Chondrus crispus]|eukprot:XP_005712453.1 unnamed protein product [Chondrus crispus]
MSRGWTHMGETCMWYTMHGLREYVKGQATKRPSNKRHVQNVMTEIATWSRGRSKSDSCRFWDHRHCCHLHMQSGFFSVTSKE